MANQVELQFILRDFVTAPLNALKGKLSGLKSDLSGMGQSLSKIPGLDMLVGAGSIYGVMKLGAAMVDLAKQGAQVQRVGVAFDQLARSAGASSDKIIASLRAASRGTISDSELMLSANRAMLLGLGSDAEQLGKLMEVAGFRGRAMGLTTAQAFSDIVTGIGRMSPMILDNLGITIDAARTFGDYAASIGKAADALTDAEKRQALLNGVIKDGEARLKEAGGAADDAASKFERYDASIRNMNEAIGMVLAGPIGNLADAIAAVLSGKTEELKTATYIEELKRKIQEAEEDSNGAYAALERLGLGPSVEPLKAKLAEAELKLRILQGVALDVADSITRIGALSIAGVAIPIPTPEKQPILSKTPLGSDVAEINRYVRMQQKGDEVTAHNTRVYWDSVRERERADKEWASKLKAAGEEALSKMRGRAESILFTPSQVTQEDMFRSTPQGAKLFGAYENKPDEYVRRLRAAASDANSVWRSMIPQDVLAAGNEAVQIYAQKQEQAFYSGALPEEVDWGAFKKQYADAVAAEQGKENLVQRAMQELGPGANQLVAKQTLGVATESDVAADAGAQIGAQLGSSFETALASLNPIQSFVGRFTADVATNGKLLSDSGIVMWNVIFEAVTKADYNVIQALAARLAPAVAAQIDWRAYAGGKPPT